MRAIRLPKPRASEFKIFGSFFHRTEQVQTFVISTKHVRTWKAEHLRCDFEQKCIQCCGTQFFPLSNIGSLAKIPKTVGHNCYSLQILLSKFCQHSQIMNLFLMVFRTLSWFLLQALPFVPGTNVTLRFLQSGTSESLTRLRLTQVRRKQQDSKTVMSLLTTWALAIT